MADFEASLYYKEPFGPAEVHTGDVFTYSDTIILNTNAQQDYFFVTPKDLIWPHLHYKVSGLGKIQIDLFEAVDYIGDKPVEIKDDKNLTSLKSKCVLLKGVKSGITKAEFASSFKGVDIPTEKIAKSELTEYPQETILKQNTKYVLSIKSFQNDNQIIVVLKWFEHEVRAV